MTTQGRKISEGRKRAASRKRRSEASKAAWQRRHERESQQELAALERAGASSATKFNVAGIETGRFVLVPVIEPPVLGNPGRPMPTVKARFDAIQSQYLNALEQLLNDETNRLGGVR